MLSVGNVVEVWVPDDECEAARDLTRALEDARDDLSRSKQRLSKFLLRHGLVFDERTPTGRRKGNWTRAHWSWIESIRFAERADEEVLAYYVDAVRRAAEEKARLERLVEGEARKPRWRRRVDSLRCLKGVDTATAADLVFEAGEFSRFRNARSFAAWVGLTPSEHSSGESDRRGAITKAGNKHLRKALVEAAWHYLTCSGRPKDLAKDQAPDRVARRLPPRACGGWSRGGSRCSRAGSTATRRTWPRRASSPAGCGRSASWPRRRRGPVPRT